MINEIKAFNKNSFTKTLDRSGRRQRGSFLVEAMVAVLVSSIIAAALASMYMQTRRVSNMSQGELIATAVAQECVDHLRVMNYSAISAVTPSTHYASLTTAGADALFPRALLTDATLDYTNMGNSSVVNGQQSVFRSINPDNGNRDDTIKIELSNGVFGSTPCVRAVVTVQWLDTSGAPRSYRLTSFLTENGLGS